MKHVTEYQVVEANTMQIMNIRVNELIKNGWQPLWNVQYSGMMYYQTMVKYESDELPVLGEIS